MTTKLNLGEKGNNETIYIECDYKSRYGGFTHRATTVMPSSVGGGMIRAKAFWCNRTWESYPYKTALHNLCDLIAMRLYNVPSSRSLYKTHKWECAKEYASELKAQVDKVRGC